MIYAIDFDGVIASGEYSETPIQKNIEWIKQLKAQGHILIFWTTRIGEDLDEAIKFCKRHGIEFDYINENTREILATLDGQEPRKIYADFYVDDNAIILQK